MFFNSPMSLLDRYVLKVFLVPLFLCFSGFLAIWLVFDLGDNIGDFMEAGVPLDQVGFFYATQLPQFVVICLPVGLLLALLYSLSKMSRANEIISMLGAGRSITRIIIPLLGVGLIATGFSLFLNYEMAPHAAAVRDELLDELKSGKKKEKQVRAYLYRNRADHRTWFIGKFSKPPMTAPSKRIHIIQQDAEGNILRKYYAERMTFDEARNEWTFYSGKYVNFDKEGNIVAGKGFSEEVIKGWSETPWRISSANLRPEYLSIPELRDYLRYNADFPDIQLAPFRTQLQYLWALPWTCFVVVFIAAPLGIVYSRRGVLAGVASSLFIFFGMVFLTELSLALGKGGRIPPGVAAWAPTIFFGLIGVALLYFRSTNRDLPTIRLRRPSAPAARTRAVATTAG
jgi:lipopolysaccharide export system permease protein